MGTARGRASKIGALIVYIIVILVATPQAQQPVAFSGVPGAMSAGPAALAPDATAIELLVGRSTILNVGTAISRVSPSSLSSTRATANACNSTPGNCARIRLAQAISVGKR